MTRQFTHKWLEECFLATCDLIERAVLVGNVDRLMAHSRVAADAKRKRQLTLFGTKTSTQTLMLDDVEVSVSDLLKLAVEQRTFTAARHPIHPVDLVLFIGVLRAAQERSERDDTG